MKNHKTIEKIKQFSNLLYRMSVSDRRMLDLIWLFGGACGGRGAAGGVDLDADGWLWELEGTDTGGILEAEEGPELAGSFTPDCGCFLGMVKVLLPTLSAPVGWSRDDPGGPEEEKTGMGGGGGAGFLDLTNLPWGGDCFFRSLALLEDLVLVLPLGIKTGPCLAIFWPRDFLPPLGDTVAAGGFFSIGAGSFFSGSLSSVLSSSSF